MPNCHCSVNGGMSGTMQEEPEGLPAFLMMPNAGDGWRNPRILPVMGSARRAHPLESVPSCRRDGVAFADHLPWNTGRRFSRKANIPSR